MAQDGKNRPLNPVINEATGLGENPPSHPQEDIERRIKEAEHSRMEEVEKQAEAQQTENRAMSPCQVFEANINNYLAQFGHMIPFTELVGFLELKLIELKESYRFTTEQNLHRQAEANNGHTH